MFYGQDYKVLPITSIKDGKILEISDDLFCYTNHIVNIVFIGGREEEEFVLIDSGLPKSSKEIIKTAQFIYGEQSKPKAIILTHGHFEHVGSIIELIEYWDVPVFAHEKEIPYLTGEKAYEEPDSTVEGGLVAKLAGFFPNEPIHLSTHVHVLEEGTVPFLSEFQWLHTPGHSPGHISLFRKRDGALIVGDSFITVRQDSLFKTFVQKEEMSGPPRYFTTDWPLAYESVKKLQRLNPKLAITGHGVPIKGDKLKQGLDELIEHFNEIAIPDYGKYV